MSGLTCISYKPGDPEFEAIAQTITPIDRVPTKSKKGMVLPHQDAPIRSKIRRRADTNKLR